MDKKELKIIKTAILNEIEGEKFYRDTAQKANLKDTRNAFLYLAEEEKQHQNILQELITKLTANQEFSIDSFNLDHTASPLIFPKSETDVDDALEISAFHIAILMEKASIDYYRDAAQTTNSEGARSLYNYLADWEVKHLESMEKIYDSLTEDWWDKQSFSPS
ncbi:MAG: ferritin family protein [Syntrophomonas sp.]|nr:ferritin family protein [Syntrophomonas sp.]